jgi:hypothetical protein
MHFKTTFHNAKVSTVALADRVEELGRGGEALLPAANLNQSDMDWWPGCLKGIADAIRAEAVAIVTPDADLIAQIPEKSLKDPYGYKLDPVRTQKVQEDHLRSVRYGKPWIFYVGILMRDSDRLLLEGILMGQKVVDARSKLRGFAYAVAFETGCGNLEESP